MNDVEIRFAVPADLEELTAMRVALWPEGSLLEHETELRDLLAGKALGTLPVAILVAVKAARLVGFLEVGLRSHADGCNPARPVGFVEGWYVVTDERRRGIGRQLVVAAEEWALRQGCDEMASDTWVDNTGSQVAHESLGYEVVDRCVNYRKSLRQKVSPSVTAESQ